MATKERVNARTWWLDMLVGVGVGLVGGVVRSLCLHTSPSGGILIGIGFGVFFSLLLAKRATSPGAGLIWGLSSALLLWILRPIGLSSIVASVLHLGLTLSDARQRFPQLVGDLVCLGAPLGVLLGLRSGGRDEAGKAPFRWGRAVVAGGFAGILSGVIFGYWMFAGDFFPLLAGLGEIKSQSIAVFAQFAVALIIGASFGLFFQREVHGYGSCMGWGVGYTMFWWFACPLTLFPLLSHAPLNWSSDHASDLFGAFVGHTLYGLILGVTYATFDRVWVRLFIQSDPLNRRREGPGLHVLRSLQWGIVAGLIGGVVSSPVMLASYTFSHARGREAGAFLLHLFISTLIGMNFGILFRDEAADIGLEIGWGWLFGLMWWYAGPLTLLPLLATGEIDWRPAAASNLLPSLVGHLIYGASTAFVFLVIERRHAGGIRLPEMTASPAVNCARHITPAPALWVFVLGLGMLLPILLG